MACDPAVTHHLRRKSVLVRPNRWYQDQQKCQRQSKYAKGDRAIAAPDQKECGNDQKRKRRLHLVHANGHQAMRRNQHFYKRHEVEDPTSDRHRQAYPLPAWTVTEEGREG